ncbi:hypothetical protein AKO1_013120 [Acrasis kona]|uniref:Homeobox domain-containing protein n=1 Tax=Acrasis kona TaxID=1008807 RepID=A0AAW2ZG71_9EUKA
MMMPHTINIPSHQNFDVSQEDNTKEQCNIRSMRYLSKEGTKILKDYMDSHWHNPYPSHEERQRLKILTGLSSAQITNWFTNHRRRFWQPSKSKVKKNVVTLSYQTETDQSVPPMDTYKCVLQQTLHAPSLPSRASPTPLNQRKFFNEEFILPIIKTEPLDQPIRLPSLQQMISQL